MKVLIVLILIISVVQSARILAFFYYPSISHQYIFRMIAKELSLHGHDVTFITPNPMEDKSLTNLTEINVNNAYETFKKFDFSLSGREHTNLLSTAILMKEFTETILDIELSNEEVKKIWKKPADSFDLLLIEAHSPIAYGLQNKFKAPLIAISSMNVYSILHDFFGNPVHPVLYPDMFSELKGPLSSFGEKLDSLCVNLMWSLFNELYLFPKADVFARKYFGNDMPYIKEEIKKTSLLMINVNPIFSDRRPTVPNVVEYFNVHLRRNEPTPKDLQEILNNAKKGAVYFSLGTNVRFDHVQGNIKESLMEALGSLPYTVLCKWESEDYPGRPKNVILRKWFPQQSVLAHQNIKVFVTQGGLQSSEEAIINAVPLVVIPFLGDQPMNAKILQGHGMAETISPKELTKEKLREAILKVAQNEKYRQKAKELRGIFLDQPQSGIDKIIWWCEYVIRHKGAKHLRSPGADIPLYEYFMLDILAVLTAAVFGIYVISRTILRQIIRLVKNTKTGNTEKKKL